MSAIYYNNLEEQILAIMAEKRPDIEFDALKRASTEIAESLVRDVNLQRFGQSLVEASLITQSTMDDCFEQPDEPSVARSLLSAVADNVRVSPKEFTCFLRVLAKENSLKIAQKNLINIYGKRIVKRVYRMRSVRSIHIAPLIYRAPMYMEKE